MSSITCREFSISIQLGVTVEVNYNPKRDLVTTVTGDRIKIHYVSGRDKPYWYLDLSGSYPLTEPQEVCACSPGVHKTRQGVSVRIGYPYEYRGIPPWAQRLAVKHSPDWFPWPEF
jgi:hypothetical protein